MPIKLSTATVELGKKICKERRNESYVQATIPVFGIRRRKPGSLIVYLN